MSKPVALTGGAYQARSVIASAQRCLNLYAEPMPQVQGEPAPFAYYPTPGLRLLETLPDFPVRAVRQATNGNIYAIAGQSVFRIDATTFAPTFLGNITPGVMTPASMADNGIDVVIVDGTSGGWTIHLKDDAFAPIIDPTNTFVGADRVDFLDGFFLFNKPRTGIMYWSGAYAVTFDALDFVAKTAFSDLLVVLAVAKKEIYLLGDRCTEVFFDAAITDPSTGFVVSQFASVPGVFIDHGCAAKYSVAVEDNSVLWLSQDRHGQGIVRLAAGGETKRISTYAIEAAIKKYPRIDDAIGFCYQINGHSFYVLTFTSADKTWVYDLGTGQWNEWAWSDSNGAEHRSRVNCVYPCNGTLLAGDREFANLYALETETFLDWGFPIKRERAFPHMILDARRLFYREFLADMETGNGPDAGDTNYVSLVWSDDRGRSWGSPVILSMGGIGEYLTSLQWQRLGMARDRVFKLSWTVNADTALQGAWITVDPADADQPERAAA